MTTLLQTDEKTLWLTEQVQAAQRGDRQALDELFRAYEGAVFATALRRLNNYVAAQELVQEVFVQAIQKIHQLRDPLCFGGWLRSITTRMAINRAVRAKPETAAAPETFEGTCVEHETPLVKALAREERVQVRQGLRRLKKLDRATLVAFYVEGRSLAEMSEEFHSPLGTIKRRLHVARKRLAKELQELASV